MVQKNRLRDQDVHKIIDTYERLIDIPYYARMVPFSEISDSKNEYNLNLTRYIDNARQEDLQNIEGHIQGGIPKIDVDALSEYWEIFPSLKDILFDKSDRIDFLKLKIPYVDLKTTISNHSEFNLFNKLVIKSFEDWQNKNIPYLQNLKKGSSPKIIIKSLSEDLLTRFKSISLIDEYRLYQHLMDYWSEMMQDECYLISDVGWKDGAKPFEVIKIKNSNNKLVWPKVSYDFLKKKKRFKSDLIPSAVLVAKYFFNDKKNIENLQNNLVLLEQEIQEIIEDNNEDEALLFDLIENEGERPKINLKSINARLKEINTDVNFVDEKEALCKLKVLLEQQKELRKIKALEEELDIKIESKYSNLEDDIKKLVIYERWVKKYPFI